MASEEYFCCKTVVDAYDPSYNQLKKSTTASVASVTGSRNGCDHIANRISKSRKFFLTMSSHCQVSLPGRSRLGGMLRRKKEIAIAEDWPVSVPPFYASTDRQVAFYGQSSAQGDGL
jgi:hypothetical protein